jgi:hypothetical protein
VLLGLAPAFGLLSACRPDSGIQKVNSPPDAQITAPADGASVLEGTTVTLRGAASDPNHDAADLSTRWFVGGIETCGSTPPAADGTTTCDMVVPADTTVDVRLEVVDPDGSAGTAEATYIVTPNADPLAVITSPAADGVYYADQLVTLRGTVSDAEDAPAALAVVWESSRDGVLGGAFDTPDGSGGLLGATTLSQGAHFLTLRVTDSVGNTHAADVTIEVGPPNSPPDCAITEPAGGSAGERGSTVTFRGSVSDVDISPDLLSVTWTSDKDGPLGTSTPTSGGIVTFPYADLSMDTHVVSMQVVDEVGATCTAEVVYTVGAAPSIDLERPVDGDVVNQGETLTFTALVADGEDVPGDLWVTWESSLDGVLYEGPPDSSGLAEFLDDTLTTGDHALTVTVTDNDGLYATASAAFSVNGIPSAPVVTLTPSSPGTDDDLRIMVTSASVDPEGDAVSYTYAWSRDGVASSASTSSTLPAGATTRGDTWSVSVTATDGLGTSAAGTAVVTVGNTAPSLASLTLTPDPAFEDDSLTCSAGAVTDADGDTVRLTYEWYVDGVALALDTDSLDGSMFDRDQEVYCAATPNDGTDDGVTRTSGSVTIGNSLPVLTSVTLAPEVAYTNDTLTASASATDADGDTLSYTYDWYVDGTLVQSGASDTLSGVDAFDRDQAVVVEVNVEDGSEGSSGTSDTLVVSNSAPTAPVVQITPADAESGDDLTCEILTGSTDADDDAITYSFAWDVDGAAHGAASDTATSSLVDGADVGAGQTWTCEVTAADDRDTVSSTTSVTTTACDVVRGSGSTYVFCANLPYLTWPEAEADCVSRGGHLATINDADEYAFIDGVVESTSVARSSHLWIGLHDLTTEGSWQWITGESGYASWAPGEPNSLTSDEDCVTFDYLDDAYAGDAQGYRDTPCTGTGPYVCEYVEDYDYDGDGYTSGEDCDEGDATVHPYAGDTYRDGIDGDCDGLDCAAASDGSTYFTVCLQSSAISAADATASCEGAGHDGLALPLSSAENSVLDTLNKSAWPSRPVSGYNVRLDGTDAAREGTWIDPRTGGVLTYTNWAPSEPTNSFGNEHCINMIGDIAYNGLWQDLGCAATSNGDYAYACETR